MLVLPAECVCYGRCSVTTVAHHVYTLSPTVYAHHVVTVRPRRPFVGTTQFYSMYIDGRKQGPTIESGATTTSVDKNR